MADIADVIERVYRDYLLPPDEQPSRFTVDTGGIDASATTLPVDTALLSPEETDLIGAGTLIEVVSTTTGGELMLVEATDDPPTSLTVRRNMFGTTAAAHIATDLIFLAPDFPRQTVFDAVADTIEGLWPRLWTPKVEETYAATDPVELPAACEEILEVRVLAAKRWVLTGGWELLTNYPLASTDKAIQFMAGGSGESIQVLYRAAPTRPTTESDVLTDLNVEAGWVKVVAVGAAAQVIANEDIDRATVDYITQMMESEGFPAGAGANLRNSLLQYQDFLIQPLAAGLEARNRTSIVIDAVL
jgi:hypothetical protein